LGLVKETYSQYSQLPASHCEC